MEHKSFKNVKKLAKENLYSNKDLPNFANNFCRKTLEEIVINPNGYNSCFVMAINVLIG